MSAHSWLFGSGNLNGLDVTMGGVTFTSKVTLVPIEDTSVTPMTVLERRVSYAGGVLTVETCETSQATFLAQVLSQAQMAVTFVGISWDGGSIGSISLPVCTCTSFSIKYQMDEFVRLSLTFETCGASTPTVVGTPTPH